MLISRPAPDPTDPTRGDSPRIDPTAVLQFVINGAAGSRDAQAKGQVIDTALRESGRRGELLFCKPDELPRVAEAAARKALAARTAVVAVGGDGTINTVAQAAHAARCPMGVVPQGTFNYFARTHGIPADAGEAVRALLQVEPLPVQVAAVNERLFLVNASLGLYPDLLEDREAYKARLGRSRAVAFAAGCATLLRAQRPLRLRIESGEAVREMRTLTLFVGNNRPQLQQIGVPQTRPSSPAPERGRLTAVMLKPIGLLSMLGLMWRGAMGTLGEADSVEHFEFSRIVVKPGFGSGRRGVKVAFDGEVTRMRAPLAFRVLAEPLYLLAPGSRDPTVEGAPPPPG